MVAAITYLRLIIWLFPPRHLLQVGHCPPNAVAPEDQVCVLGSYIRQRECLIKSAGTHVQRMQKALIQMNLHLHKVISDITGLTGMAIIRSIVAGEREPEVLAKLKDPRIKSTTAEIAKALTGDYRLEHVFVLKQELTLYQVYQQEITSIDQEIEKCLVSFEAKVNDEPPPSKRKRRKKPTLNNPNFNLRQYLYQIVGVDFTLIDGLDVLAVQTILSEVGLERERFPTVKHFCSRLTVYVLVKKLLVVKSKAPKLVLL